jgi:hypothetical protein
MKKLKLLFCFSFFIFNFSLSYGQSWCWGAEGAGGVKDDDYGAACATDKYGYGYFTGQYATQMTIDTTTLMDYDDQMFLLKFNATGNLLWARQAVGDSLSYGSSYGVAVTTDNGDNEYVTGFYDVGSIIFGSDTLSGPGNGFLVKYSPAGNVLWALSFDGYGQTVTTDKYDNVYVGTINGGGLSKYGENGNLLWNITDDNQILSIYSVTTDKALNVYITGSFNYTTKIGNDSLFAPFDESEMFLVKLTPGGGVLWAKQSKAPFDTAQTRDGWGQAVITDGFADVYVAGYFQDTLTWGVATLITQKPDTSVFLAKYDSIGQLVWVTMSKGNGNWMGYSLSTDKNNHIYLGGSGTGDTLTFGGMTLSAASSPPSPPLSSFIFVLGTSGNAISGSMLNNGVGPPMYGTYRIGISSDSTGYFIYMAGTAYQDTVFCGPDTLVANDGGLTPYFARWHWNAEGCMGQTTTDIPPISLPQTSNVILYPNPNNGKFTLSITNYELGITNIEVYNILGEKVYSQFNIQNPTFNIDLSANPNGIYLYRVISEDGSLIGGGKVIIQK